MNSEGLKTRVALIAHGSRDPNWCRRIESFAQRIAGDLGENQIVLCFMELNEPTLMQVAEVASQQGVERLKVIPMFMASGGHVDKDIPVQAKAVQTTFPQLKVEVLPPLGEHPQVLQAMAEAITDALSST